MEISKSASSVKAIAGNKARVQKYRSTHRRIDYVPCPEALAAIFSLAYSLISPSSTKQFRTKVRN